MQTARFNRKRRMTLQWLFTGSILGIFPLPALVQNTLAMGRLGTKQEVKKVRGDVTLNGRPAGVGTPVHYGDVVVTGSPGMAIFVLGSDVFLVRDNTRLELPAKPEETLTEKAGAIVRLTRGKMLAVLGKGRKQFTTPTAVVGIRGTGLYLEAEAEKSYACLCYGTARLSSSITGHLLEEVQTRHHDSPRYIYKTPTADGKLIARAPVINHTDAELVFLESLVSRKPPFTYPGQGY